MFLLEVLFENGGLIWGILMVILFVKISHLKKRVKDLESKGVATAKVVQSQVPEPQAAQAEEAKAAPVAEEQEDEGPGVFELFTHWLKDDWLLKLGALLLLIGFGWLVTYAFLNNWIGPAGRITLGIFAGACILVLGAWRIRTRLHQGTIFTALGSTVILLTVFAAREMYDFFNPMVALSIMFLSNVFVAFVSVKHKAMSLAVVALVLAAIAPSLTGGSSGNYVSLFSYLSVVILGVIWVVTLTGWRALTLLALILAAIYSIPVLGGHSIATKSTILLFAYGFGSLFFVFNTIGLLRVKDKSTRADIFTAAGNGVFLLAWILSAVKDEWQSLVIVAWMLVFAIGAFIIFKYTRRKFAFYIYAGIGIAMLGAATAAELNGAALTIAYVIESAIISLITYVALKDHIVGQRFSLLMIGPMLMAFESIERFDRSQTVFNKYFFVILVLALGLFVLGFAYRYFSRAASRVGFFGKLYIAQIITASLYIYILLWYSLQNGIDTRSIAVMIAMIIYTIIGLITNIYGKFQNSKVMSVYGGVMLAFVVLRLLVVDVWQMDLTRRIITFFLVGALLISTAFINKKKDLDNN